MASGGEVLRWKLDCCCSWNIWFISVSENSWLWLLQTTPRPGKVHTDYIAYHTLKWRIDNPNSLHENDDIRRMKDLHMLPFATSNLANTSNVTNTSISTSAYTLSNDNEITASFESTPPPSSDPSTTSSLPSSNDKTRASSNINSLSNQLSIFASYSMKKITASF